MVETVNFLVWISSVPPDKSGGDRDLYIQGSNEFKGESFQISHSLQDLSCRKFKPNKKPLQPFYLCACGVKVYSFLFPFSPRFIVVVMLLSKKGFERF